MPPENDTGTVEQVVVSGSNGTTAQVTVSAAAPENTEKRLSDLMSRADKLKNELDKERKEKETLKQEKQEAITAGQLERLRLEETQKTERAKTHQVLEDTVTAAGEYERLYKEIAEELKITKQTALKAQTIAQNPWLGAYAELLPATGDPIEMEKVVGTYRKAYDLQASTIKQQLGAFTPNVRLDSQGPTEIDLSDPAKMDKFLQEAQTNPKEFQRRMVVVREFHTKKK